MDKPQYRLSGTPALTLPLQDAERLLALADGNCALLYLYTLHGGVLEPAAAARMLRRTEKEILTAAERLREMGLLASPGEARLPPPDELPEIPAEEIARRAESDPAFRGLVTETQRIMGRMLSGSDLRILYGVYDHLGLPPEVILLLMNHCADTVRERYGEGRTPTMRAIEKEAYIWANREILTLEQAEAHLRELSEKKDASAHIRRILQIYAREPSATERKYIDSWLDMGFPPEALAIAYDRTVISTGKLSWRYMDSIVKSWHGKGLHSPSEIERFDSRPGSRKPAAQLSPSAETGDDLERLLKKYS
jgi:hypothetical protein